MGSARQSPLVGAARIGRRFARLDRAELDRTERIEPLLPHRFVEAHRPGRCRAALGPLDRVVIGRTLDGDQQRGLAVRAAVRRHRSAAGQRDERVAAADLEGAEPLRRERVRAGILEAARDLLDEGVRRGFDASPFAPVTVIICDQRSTDSPSSTASRCTGCRSCPRTPW
jgi:hypothetical protein